MGRGKLTRQNRRLMGAKKPCLSGLFYPPCLVLLSKFLTRECLNDNISVFKLYLRLKKKVRAYVSCNKRNTARRHDQLSSILHLSLERGIPFVSRGDIVGASNSF